MASREHKPIMGIWAGAPSDQGALLLEAESFLAFECQMEVVKLASVYFVMS